MQLPLPAAPPSGSPRSPLSTSSDDSEGPLSPRAAASRAARAAERAAQRAAEKRMLAAQRKERAALVARRDTLAYFDAARVAGTLVFVDTVPLAFNALLVATVGNVVSFPDGGLRCVLGFAGAAVAPPCDCGSALHLFVQGLVAFAYLLLAYLSSVLLGAHVTSHINAPFLALALGLAGLLAWSFFYGVPLFLVVLADLGAFRACWSKHPYLFGALPPARRPPPSPPPPHPITPPPPPPPPHTHARIPRAAPQSFSSLSFACARCWRACCC